MAEASATSLEGDLISTMSPDEAGQVLAERAADFRSAVPTVEQVRDVNDARIRLAQLTNDPAWAKAFLAGSAAERREFDQLTTAIAGDDAPFVEGPSEVTAGAEGVRRQDLISTISHLGKVGIPPEGIERALTGDFTPEDIEWGQRQLDRAMATKEWTDGLLRGDPTCVHEWTAYCALIAAGKVA